MLTIDITQGNVTPLPIALGTFTAQDPQIEITGNDIRNVIERDLTRSGLFRSLPNHLFETQLGDPNQIPNFQHFSSINASALLTGTINPVPNTGEVSVTFRLWDPYAKKELTGKSYVTKNQHWRRVAHMIADHIYEHLTGEKGYFDTRIVYISEEGPANQRVKRLAVMDQDGANHRYLTDGNALVLTPRFSPNLHQVIYMSYHTRVPSVFVRDLISGNQRKLGNFLGMSFAPRFAPSNKKAVMSSSTNGNAEIYEINLNSGATKRLTNDPAIDTSPSYSPDERYIVFNSDRGGSQQLYVMHSDGSDVRRISFGKGRYGTPVWSPRGDLIAFTKMLKGVFHIGVMKPDGSGERLLTSSYMDEGPTWSPNGRVIIFTRQFRSQKGQTGRSRLYSIDLTGYNEQEIPTPNDASDPAWSPLL